MRPLRSGVLVAGVCAGLMLSLNAGQPAAALSFEVSPGAAPGQGQDAAPTEPVEPQVSAQGEAPEVDATVVSVQAPYALPTTSEGAAASGEASSAGATRAKVITLDEARTGTVWTANSVTAGNCSPSSKSGRDGLTVNAQKVMDCIDEVFPQIGTYYGVGHRSANSKSDHPRGLAVDAMIDNYASAEGNALGWQIANYVADNSSALNVKYIIWDAQIYIPGSGWRPYRHPTGATDPNSAHLNHVHVSVR